MNVSFKQFVENVIPQHRRDKAAFGAHASHGYTAKSELMIPDRYKVSGGVEENILNKLRKQPGTKVCGPNLLSHIAKTYPNVINTLNMGEEKQLGRTGNNTYQVFIKKEMHNNMPIYKVYSKKEGV
jgi:hypothetical protein